MPAAKDVSVTTQVTTQAATVFGLDLVAGVDAAEYEIRDGDAGSSTLVAAAKAPAGGSDHVVLEGDFVSQLRVVAVSGTGAKATVHYR